MCSVCFVIAVAAQEEAEKASGAAAPMSSQDADRLRETEQQVTERDLHCA